MKNMMKLLVISGLIGGCAGAVGDDGGPIADEEANYGVSQSALIADGIVNCESGPQEVQLLCQMALNRVNSELDARGITIDHDGILFEYDDPTDKKISTGHSCTSTAEQKHVNFTARLKSSADLDVSGNSLTRPLVMKLSLPTEYSARIDVKQRFGKRILGSCSNYASDSYTLRGDVSTTADLVLGLTLNPTFGFRENGDYAITIEPKVGVGMALHNTDIDFRVSGVSPLTPVLTFATATTSTVAKSATALFQGDSVRRVISDSAAWDFGAPMVLGIGALPRPLEDGIFNLMGYLGAMYADAKKVPEFRTSLQTQLQQKLNQALRLEDGKRVFIVDADFMQLLAAGASAESLFASVARPPDPYADCQRDAAYSCSSCPSCCEALYRQCYSEYQEYLSLYPPLASTIINSRPMEPRYTPAPPECSGTATTCDAGRVRSCRSGSYHYQNCSSGCVIASGNARCK